jgi:integrase
MTYSTKKITHLNLNYDKFIVEPTEENGIFKISSTHYIDEITILINSETNVPVEPVTTYLINRHLLGKENSSFEARGLRLYFDFLESINKSWLDGSDEVFNRPLSLFSKSLKYSFEKGEIAGTVAINYFNCVVRFYQFHLEKGQKFNGSPISFKTKKIEFNTNDLTNHITKYSVEINTADCAPNIPSTAKSSELKPLTMTHLKLLFKTLKEKSTPEFFLICLIAQSTGLRIGEIADLKLEHISKYDDEPIFNLYVGPQVGHHTKGNQNGVIKVNKTVMNIIKEHTLTSAYLKRLGRFKGDKPYLILNRKGEPYTQEVLSVMFNQFMHQHIKPLDPSFSYKFHDLRATFGVSIMKACLDAKMSRSDALAYTQNQMRHKSLETTLHYLEYWTHSVVNEQKSKMQEDLLSSVTNSLSGII